MLPGMQEPDSPYLKPKRFTEWYALDYFRRSWRLWLHGKWLLGAPIGVCLIWLAAESAFGNRRIYQVAPVSPGHLEFNNDCGQCHTGVFQTVRRLVNPQARTVPDSVCNQCHGDTPKHSIYQVRDPNCTECHREHGRMPTLTHVGDQHCTSCHGDLHRNDDSACEILSPIRGFVNDDHPDFRWPRDNGTVRFNHAVHLKENLLDKDRKPVTLDCNACHQSDTDGRYMKPIRYELHCKECHPLSIQVVGELQDPEVRTAAETFRQEPAPHKEPAVVRAALAERYSRFVKEHPEVVRSPLTAQSDRFPPGRPRPPVVIADAEPWANYQRQTAERLLFLGAGGCRYCHAVRTISWKPEDLPKVAATNIRPRWLSHSIFSHESHSTVSCTDCHCQAACSEKTSDVLMPAIRTCQECHHPQAGSVSLARTDCVECHRYHDSRKEHWFRQSGWPDRKGGP